MLIGTPKLARGAFTDFEDLTAGRFFSVGEIVTSRDVTFAVVDDGGQGAGISVGPGFVGNGIGFAGKGLDFQVPMGTDRLMLLYYVASSADIVVNGASAPARGTLLDLNGTQLGGVTINATRFDQHLPGFRAKLDLQGALASFIIRGSEVTIDDVSIVPEPRTVMLAAISGVAASVLVARRHRERISA